MHVGFVTVRSSSSRLPGKCFLPFGEGSVLDHIVSRARHFDIEPVVCTSTSADDDAIEALARRHGVRCFRGSLNNKLRRWRDCCDRFGFDRFHTVDADDPFFDGELMAASLEVLDRDGWDVVSPTPRSSAGEASVGYSLRRDAIDRALENVEPEADTEMMWHWLERVPDLRRTTLDEGSPTVARMRLTLDYEEDYWLLRSVLRLVGPLAPRAEVDDLFARNPDLHKVNWFRNDQWKEAQEARRPA